MLSTKDLRELKANAKDSKISDYCDMLIFISMEDDMKRRQAEEASEASKINEKIKEYGFDSLMFRYKEAREKQKQLEIIQEKEKCRVNGKVPKIDKIEFEYTRDFMRFREILDDIIGKHN